MEVLIIAVHFKFFFSPPPEVKDPYPIQEEGAHIDIRSL
jgi:hypothetical protein